MSDTAREEIDMTIPINDLHRHTASMRAELDTAVQRVLDRGWFVLGPEVEAFETEFAAWCGSAHCVGLANGTDALQLALQAVGVGPGSRIATVANAGMYGTAAMRMLGAEPVFVDVRSDTLLIDAKQLDGLLRSGRIDAILVTHLYGRLADIEDVIELARQRGIPVIEDCAQAHGAQRRGRRAGSFGDIGCFSFYPTKNLGAIGDGGAVITSRPELAERLRRLRQYGWSMKYHATEPGGRNSRLDEVQAAVLRAKLPRLELWTQRRMHVADVYREGIRNPRIGCPPAAPAGEHVWHLFVIRVAAQTRDDLRRHLGAAGVGTDVHYPVPDHRQVALGGVHRADLPVTDLASAQVLTLPCFPELADEELARVVSALNAW
jgi:dTDP-3-amino-2,3,6-trideoxy-4-keto-D-glucose/dTDP-3-amino-3,4,6-trideoxy-alpha-D-glucose/dTDP-2,6-dideoxy-D-kanosamine transaminase